MLRGPKGKEKNARKCVRKEESKECKMERARRGMQMCKECTEKKSIKEGNIAHFEK